MNDGIPRRALSTSERARSEALERAAQLGSAGVAMLVDMLADPSWIVRRRVVAVLATMGEPAAVALKGVIEGRRDDERVNAAAMDALVANVSPAATAAMLSLVDHPDGAVVADAVHVLGRRGAREAIPALARLAAGPDDNVAVAAIESLGRVGGRASVESLVSLVRSGNFFRTFPAIDVLGRCGDPRATAPLAALVSDSRYAMEAMRALGRTGDRAAAKPLAAALTHPSATLRRVAASALVELAKGYAERYGVDAAVGDVVTAAAPVGAGRALGAALKGATTEEEVAIAEVLGMLRDPEATRVLARLVEGSGAVSKIAVHHLTSLGAEARAELGALLRAGDSARRAAILPVASGRTLSISDVMPCLDDPDGKVRALAAETLATCGATEAVPRLFELLEDPNPRVVQAVVGAVQSLPSPRTEALTLAALRSEVPMVRCEALRIARHFAFESALDAATALLREGSDRLREAATLALAALSSERAAEVLFAASTGPDPKLRGLATRALGHRAPSPEIGAALLRASDDSDPWVRYYAAQALGKIAPEGALERLQRMLTDGAVQVRLAAVEALAHFRSDDAFRMLLEACDAPEEDVRRAAVMGLGMARREEAKEHLFRALVSSDAATRLVAAAALEGLDGPDVVEKLRLAAIDVDRNVASVAEGLLASRPSEEATRALVSLLRVNPASDRVRLALSAPSPGRIRGLRAALEEADDEGAPALASAFVRMRTADATLALIGVLASPNAAARKAAATALGTVREAGVEGALRDAMATDEDAEVRRICALSLAFE